MSSNPSRTGTVRTHWVHRQAAFAAWVLVVLAGSLFPCPASASGESHIRTGASAVQPAPFSISGTVFEDVNYGGGAGRDKATALSAGGSGRPNARVELFDQSGSFITSTTTDANGDFSFTSLNPGVYTVRVVNASVSSARSGYLPGIHLAVQTFRAEATSGSAIPMTDRVGGEDPQRTDAGDGNSTLASLTTGTSTAQSISTVLMDVANASSVDFGYCFDVVVNTNDSGQGSLEQFIVNSNGLGDEASLVQAGSRRWLSGPDLALPTGKETSVFMIPDGQAHPGLRAGLTDQLTGGVAIIAPSALSPITGVNTILDATTQTVNVGNTNAALLGTGGMVGADDIILSQVPGPEVQVSMSASGNPAFDIQADQVMIRGVAVIGAHNGGAIAISASSNDAWIEMNVLGSSATSFVDPGSSLRNSQQIASSGADDVMVRHNLVGFAASIAFSLSNGCDGWQIRRNELLDNGLSSTNGDGIIITSCAAANIEENLITGTSTQGIILHTVSATNVTNNTISGNGVGTTDMDQTAGITLRSGSNDVLLDRNKISANYGAGIQVNAGAGGIELTRNLIHDNGTITARNGDGPTGQVGIDLNNGSDNSDFGTAPFFTLNDISDTDAGGNALQNFPVLTSGTITGCNTTITGTLNSDADRAYRVEFFTNTLADASGYGEGQVYLGSTIVNTDISGNATINAVLDAASVTSGHKMCATATDLATGSTSEFSAVIDAAVLADVIIDPPWLTTDESGPSIASFTVVLGVAPTADVTIGLASQDATEGTLSATSLTFTPSNWNVAQTVEVTAVDELIDDGDVSYAVVTSDAVSADPYYSNACVEDVLVINVDDDASPVAVCMDFTVSLDANGQATIAPIMIDGGSTDDLGIISYSADPSGFDCGDIGPNNATLTVTDAGGNSSVCNAVVTVVDLMPPSIICPSDITINNDPGVCGAMVSYVAPIGMDNCSGSATMLTAGLPSGSLFPLGTTTISYMATDAGGNSASCSFNVVVNDMEAPVASCQSATVALDLDGLAIIPVVLVNNNSTDNCGIDTVSLSLDTLYAVGTYPIDLTVIDVNGNQNVCSTTVTVVDNLPPTAVCQPLTIYLDATGGASITAEELDGGSTDNGTLASMSATPSSFTCVDTGANDVTLTVLDAGGNSDQCVTTVIVLDTIAPTVQCQNISIDLVGNNVVITAAQVDNGSSDNCGINTMMVTPDSFNAPGIHTVDLTVIDASGNQVTCQATVTVIDAEPPTAVCQSITLFLDDTGQAGISAGDVDGGSSDNTGIAGMSINAQNFGCSDISANYVTLTVTDDQGNDASCVAVVTVLDTIAPAAVCMDITLVMENVGSVSIDASQLDGGSMDNCNGLQLTSDPSSFSAPGTYAVVFTVIDASGNSDSCMAMVTVEVHETLGIPSGFSPNGDGIADTWSIQGLPPGALVKATIINRWGDIVYASDNYTNDWDGSCDHGVGSPGPLPDGTYFYLVEVSGSVEMKQQAYLQIAR